MITIYNHQYLHDDGSWVFIFLDQLKLIEDSGLYNSADLINVIAIGHKPQLALMQDLASSYNKIKLSTFQLGDNQLDERVTLNIIHRDSSSITGKILYIHSKGSTAFEKYFKNGNTNFFKNYYYWRKYCEWGVIEQWRKCVDSLSTHDIVGVNFNQGPLPHFSGGMWWANAEYIQTLDDINNSAWWAKNRHLFDSDRMISEMWPCHNTAKIYNIHSPTVDLQWPNHGVYSVTFNRSNYV